MSTPVTEQELFAALSGYASTLEVQFMIEEEVKKFQEKTLPRLLTEALKSDAATSAGPTATAGPSPSSSSHASTPDTEWVRTFLKAHIDDTVARRLPTMIAQEVQRQLRSVTAPSPSPSKEGPTKNSNGSPPHSSQNTTNITTNTNVNGATDIRSAMGLPPLPPPPSSASPLSSPLLGSAAAPPSDDARRQREQILRAIDDIESQVNQLQRVVDAAVVERKVWGRRWANLGAVLTERMRAMSLSSADGAGAGGKGSDGEGSASFSLSAPLNTQLERLLDEPNDDHALLLRTLGAAVQSVLPLHPAHESNQRSPSLFSHERTSGSAAVPTTSPVLSARRRRSSLSMDAHRPLPQMPSQQETPEASPRRVSDPATRVSLLSSEPPSPPPTAPSSSAASRHAADTSAAAPPPVELPLQHQPPPPQPQTQPHSAASSAKAGTRSITTKGSCVTSPSSGSASTRSLHTDVLSMTTVPQLDGVRAAAAGRHNGLDGTAVRRPTLQTRDGGNGGDASPRPATPQRSRRVFDDVALPAAPRGVLHSDETASILPASTSRHKTSHRSAATASASTSAPAITLGIDAVNVPPGVLPDALGRHGAVCVQSVTARQLAERAGVHRGDVLLSLDHQSVRSCEQLRDVLAAVPPTQSSIAVEVYRHSAHQIITVHLQL